MAPHESPRRVLPIFPLPNAILFPDTRLPLHIFEPRYRQMTADALDGDGLIGIVLLRGADPQGNPPVYDVGGAGRITECEELPDGRYQLILEGQWRFRILEELPSVKLYRQVQAEPLSDCSFDDLTVPAREALLQGRARIEEHVLELARQSAPSSVAELKERMDQLDPVQLVHALALGLDATWIEKQSLLEAPEPVARCELLLRLIEFRRAESELPAAPRSVN